MREDRAIAAACGVFGLLLMYGSFRSVLEGEVTLRRYAAPLSEAWPIVLLLFLTGLLLTVLATVAYRRG